MLDVNALKALVVAISALISVLAAQQSSAPGETDQSLLEPPVTEVPAPTAPAPATAVPEAPPQEAPSVPGEVPTAEVTPVAPTPVPPAELVTPPEAAAPAPAAPVTPTAPATPVTPAPPVGPSPADHADRPFDAGSPWNSAIPADPVLDADSAAMVGNLAQGGIANIGEYGVTVYEAPAGTPRLPVPCSMDWGTCPFEGDPAPLTPEFQPTTGSDGAMVVIDRSASPPKLYEFWQYSWNGGSPTTSWGAVGPWTGSGMDGQGGRAGNAVGAEVSRVAGVVRTDEIAAGVIDHALVFSTSFCKVDEVRAPAQQTDGKYSGVGAVPEGARIQLDPSLNPDSYTLTKAERAVFVAMQKYGAYAIDCGGDPAAYSFETPTGGNDPYAEAGLTADFQKLNLPWDKLRVLQQWDGT